jgi:inorganic pyrophosphatase
VENFLSSLPPRDESTGLVNVVIDTPRGSRNKYKYDEKLGCFKLSRILPKGFSFPYDFGSIPQTRAEDGDALDVLVMSEDPLCVGCLVTVRLLGVIAARQTEKGKTITNDRLIAAPQTPANKPGIRKLKDVEAETLRQLEHFFIAYNEAEGRRFEPTRRAGPAKAMQLLEAAQESYRQGR